MQQGWFGPHVWRRLRQPSQMPFVQLRPLQHGADALHIWPVLPHVPPWHVPLAPQVKPEQHGWFGPHVWPAPPHVPLWHVSVGMLQLSPGQHAWPRAQEPP